MKIIKNILLSFNHTLKNNSIIEQNIPYYNPIINKDVKITWKNVFKTLFRRDKMISPKELFKEKNIMNNKTIGIAVNPDKEESLLSINSDKLIERLEKRIKLYKTQMLKIENDDINFLNNKAYINLNASCFQLQDIINLIKLNMM